MRRIRCAECNALVHVEEARYAGGLSCQEERPTPYCVACWDRFRDEQNRRSGAILDYYHGRISREDLELRLREISGDEHANWLILVQGSTWDEVRANTLKHGGVV